MLHLLIFCSSSEHNKAKKKWLLFRRQHFQMHFLEWKLLNFEQDFTKICSLVSNWQYVSIGSDNGLASNRCQAIIWSNVCMLYWHICITQLQWVNIWAGAVHFLLTISLVMIVGIHVRYLIIIQTEVWITSHCLGLDHETMVCTLCPAMFSFRLEHRQLNYKYHKSSDVSRTLVGNKFVDHSDVVGAAPVGTAPTTSSFST